MQLITGKALSNAQREEIAAGSFTEYVVYKGEMYDSIDDFYINANQYKLLQVSDIEHIIQESYKFIATAAELPKIWEKPFYTEGDPMYDDNDDDNNDDNNDEEEQPKIKSSIIKYVIDCVYMTVSLSTYIPSKEKPGTYIKTPAGVPNKSVININACRCYRSAMLTMVYDS